MGLFRKKPASGSDSEAVDRVREKKPKKHRGEAHPWTQGSEAGSKMLGGLIAICLVCAPLGAGMGWLALNKPSQAVAQVEDEQLTPAQESAGGYALGFVGAWLQATRDDPGQLGAYIGLDGMASFLSPEPWEYRDLTVVSATPVEEQFMTVLVAANVAETVTDADGKEATSWPRRYWQVPVAVNGGVRVTGFPTPVAAPARGSGAALAYPESVAISSAAGETVMDFLGAYFAGGGEITRFVSPEAAITPISPAPFVQVEPVSLAANEAPAESPGDGDRLRVSATIAAQNVDARVVTMTYALTMTARAGRWEVLAIDDAPLAYPPDPAATPTAAPTPAVPSTDPTDTPSN